MFDKLLEKIQRVDEIENKLLSIFEGKTWEQIALALYQILDDIDTASDIAKEDLKLFQGMVMRLQAKKNEFLYSPDGYNVVRVDEDRDKDLRASVETLVRNELAYDPDIPTEELFQNVLDGVKDEVRVDVERVLPQVYNKVLHRYSESKVNENLTGHARRELELAGMFDKEVDGSEATGSWNRLCAEAVIELMEVFAEQGHSGFSASMTQDLFSRLARYEKLTELTDNSNEWGDIGKFQGGKPGWQSTRSPSCFSEDGGKTYWDIDEDWNKHEDEDGSVWCGGLSEEEWNNRPMHQSKHIEKEE